MADQLSRGYEPLDKLIEERDEAKKTAAESDLALAQVRRHAKDLEEVLTAVREDCDVRLHDRAERLEQAEKDLVTMRAGFVAEKDAKLENFQVIRTICKVLCDLECEEGCDEGLYYEGDEWMPCSCIYRTRQTAVRCETCQATRGVKWSDVPCWGPRDCIGMLDE